MIDSFIIGAYWGSKLESLHQIANKILQTLKRLSDLDEQFLNWYEGGVSRKKALEKKFYVNIENIEGQCLEMVRKGELDESGFAKHSFLFGLWTGQKDEESSSISFSVGGAFITSNLSNRCVIDIPFEGAGRERLLQPQKAKAIIAILVEIWKPDYAVLTSDNMRDELKVLNEIGWITYQRSIKRKPHISNKVIYEKLDNGHLFYLANNGAYDYSLVNEFLPLKEVI